MAYVKQRYMTKRQSGNKGWARVSRVEVSLEPRPHEREGVKERRQNVRGGEASVMGARRVVGVRGREGSDSSR